MNYQRIELSDELVNAQVKRFEFIIIGGGATGLGCALDAISRGYSTLLLEKDDFASGTSSRSTKLIHGGVRYLQQFDFPLVTEALYERGLLLQNASDIVHPLRFMIPAYNWYDIPYYFTGLKLYDILAGKSNTYSSTTLTQTDVLRNFPNLVSARLSGGVQYGDAQFDDALLAISLMQTATQLGAKCVNYCEVTELLKNSHDKLIGVKAFDKISNQYYSFEGRVIINASGIFSNQLYSMDTGQKIERIMTSRGSHIVVDKAKLSTDHAMLIPKTKDGRVLFVIPWYDKSIIGTTDILDKNVKNDPRISKEEVDYILETVNPYLRQKLNYQDITSTFTGLRPLVKPGKKESSKSVSRKHKIECSESGMISILGGKWTTYRSMAEDTVDYGVHKGNLPFNKSRTHSMKLEDPNHKQSLAKGGCLNEPLIDEMISQQMATSLADILARRSRLTFLDINKSLLLAESIRDYCDNKSIGINVNMDEFRKFSEGFTFDMSK